MTKELNYYQRLTLRIEDVHNRYGRTDLAVKDQTLYRKCRWTYVKNKRIWGWLPVLKKEGSDWIGYNYSAKDMATHLLNNEDLFKWRWQSLKWAEIGRSIGGRGTTYEWNTIKANSNIITKMINPTLDMLLPIDTFRE